MKPSEDERQKATEAENFKLVGQVRRMRRVEKFLTSDFYKEDFLPMLEMREGDLRTGALWSPKCEFNADRVAMGAAFNGGRSTELRELRLDLKIWMEQGIAARAKLKERGIEA